MEHFELCIVGAGVVGLALAERFARTRPRSFSIVLVESNASFGQETSSRNSEVIHAGIYYTPGSLKAQLCLEGRHLLYQYCQQHGIAHPARHPPQQHGARQGSARRQCVHDGDAMSKVVLTVDECGKLVGHSDKDERAFAKFRNQQRGMVPGDTIAFSWKAPRSPAHHRMFFGQVGTLFESQEQFDDANKLRQWLTVGAGYCDFVPGPNGRMVALPKSISWEEMDEAEFSELHAAVLTFLWSKHARTFLWPHLNEQQTWDAVQAAVGEGS